MKKLILFLIALVSEIVRICRVRNVKQIPDIEENQEAEPIGEIEPEEEQEEPIEETEPEKPTEPPQEEEKAEEQPNIPIKEETPPEPPKQPEKVGKELLSFRNADVTKVDRLIKSYGHFRTKYEGITIHNNGNVNSTAMNDVNWALNNIGKANVSWHYSVDDKEVVRFLATRYGHSCWCAGDGARGFGNSKTINIEINEFNGFNNPNDPRYVKARQNAIYLIAQLCYDEGWTIKNIGRHQDRSGKNCPRVINKHGYVQFLKEVEEHLNKIKASKQRD